MPNDLYIPLDRITYRDGQLLTVADMRDDQRRHQRLQRLHTRHLHDTWGIALGFEMKKSEDSRGVIAGPGYAVDSWGRDILSDEGIHLPVPTTSTAMSFVLAVSYQEDEAYRDRSGLEVLCLNSGLDPRNERPIFLWLPPDDVEFGSHVPLTQITVLNGKIQSSLDPRVRRLAQPFVRPHFGWGMTEGGRTGWKKWGENEKEFGLKTSVDISHAGFTKAPYVFAVLQGEFSNRVGDPSPLFQQNIFPVGSSPSFFLGSLGSIAQTTSEGFTYQMVISDQFLFDRRLDAIEAEDRNWRIYWMGAEPVTGCEPALNLSRIFALAGPLISKILL